MSLFMSLDCPYCTASRAPFEVQTIAVWKSERSPRSLSGTPAWFFDASGICKLCGRTVVASFHGSCSLRPEVASAQGDLRGTNKFQGHEGDFRLLSQAPEAPKPDIPAFLPDHLQRPFLEAEKAFAIGLWGSAAASYRKTVERSINPLIADQIKPGQRPMLGKKIGYLESTGLLPPAMLDWIRIVKDDGNFALHDDDQDFDTRDQVEPAREFAFTLLTYLYTLPEKVRIARERVSEKSPAKDADPV